MPSSIQFTLCSEGPSDRVLLRHIEWALENLTALPFSGEWADPSVFQNPSKDVMSRVSQAVAYYPCNLLFVHRDADGQGYEGRKNEVVDSLRRAGVGIPAVAVIPVRMTESWLLCDESALRKAAGRPRGAVKLPIPTIKSLERHANPKQTFEDCLCTASEKTGRKLDVFRRDLPSLKYRVAELIEDFSQLESVPAFKSFMTDLKLSLDAIAMRD